MKNCIAVNKGKDISVPENADIKLLSLGSGRNRGQVATVVVLFAVGDEFRVFGISAVCDVGIGDLILFYHIRSLLFFRWNDKKNDIQYSYHHLYIPLLASTIYTSKSWYAINKEKGWE